MSALEVFQYDGAEVRTVVIDGEPWFVLADLCAVLGLEQVSRVKARLDDALTRSNPIEDRSGRSQMTNLVSEPGMYEVVIRSDKPEAAAFRRWITGTVLPTIRKTGSYGTAPALPQSYADALRELAATVDQNAALEAKVQADAPKVEYIDTFVAPEDLRILRNVAKSLDIAEDVLRQALVDHKWIYEEVTERWSGTKQQKEKVRRYSSYSDKRSYFRPIPNHDAPRFKGELMHTLKITPQGAVAISRAAQSWGLVKEAAHV